MRILLSAYACEPNQGSEPGVGWNWAVQAALHGHDVHVITRANNRVPIEAAQQDRSVAGLSFHYYDLPAPMPAWKKRSGTYGMLVYYYWWQLGAWRLARRLHRESPFDLSHHVTFVNDWLPASIGWVGAPFVWGPVGGSTNVIPWRLRGLIPRNAWPYEAFRWIMQRTLRSLDPLVALTRRRARVILTFTEQARAGIPKKHQSRARAVVHIGVSASEAPPDPSVPGGSEVLTIVSGSRLVHWKGFDLLVEGFAAYLREADGEARLLITGDGPLRSHLEARVEELDVGGTVEFLGHLPTRAEVLRVVGGADVYALPTLRDGPPVAILEAMLTGRPILCLDRGATAEMVPDHIGFKIPVHSRPQIIADIAAALRWADDHRDELAHMGQSAREHALDRHDWDRIGVMIDAIYREVDEHDSRPYQIHL
jgi:glycosyltransferase involved in cell wall biosynthesis